MRAIESIKVELRERLEFFRKENKLIEEQRIEQRTRFDLEMMQEIGFTKGIENYSRPGGPSPSGSNFHGAGTMSQTTVVGDDAESATIFVPPAGFEG